jgi:FtsP/CotA-like multicopper oxidase with cupredoxin domain
VEFRLVGCTTTLSPSVHLVSGVHIGFTDTHRYVTRAFLGPTGWLNNAEQGEYVDGLRSPLVIHPEKEVYSYDAEYTVIISDWYHKEHAVLIKEFLSPSNPGGVEPIPGQLASPIFVVEFRDLRSYSSVR